MKAEDIKDLKELIEFLKGYDVAEFNLERGELKIGLKFATAVAEVARTVVAPQATVAAPAVSAAAEPAADPNVHMVTSPIVGTFYGSPTPGAEPFVSVGDRVEKGKIIGIVEAMKLMNEIECDVTGEVVKCLVANGQPVEYGQPLFAVRVG